MKTPRQILVLSLLLAGASLPWFTGCASTPTRESTGQYIDDSSITTKVKAAFVGDPVVSAHSITVETYKGIVQLSGFVDTPEEKARAGEVATSVPGVRRVQNNITVK